MTLSSNWKLTHDPAGAATVLVAYNDELAEEPLFSLRRGLEVIPIPGGVPFLRPTLSDVYEFSLTLVKSSATDALARRDMLNQLTDYYDSVGRLPLRLEIANQTDRYYQFANCFITSSSVRRATSDGPDGAWLLQLSFTATALTKTTL